MPNGLFLSIEGIDGSGKSTQLDLLTARLEAAGIPFLINREPGGSTVGRQIREILLNPENPVSPVAELLLYFANRAQNVDEQIRPALAAGTLVISDRYTDSTLAYQGAARGLGQALVRNLHEIACRGTEPALTVYLRVSPAVSAERLSAQKKDRLEAEGPGFHARVYEAYEALAAAYPTRMVAIDGDREASLIAGDIWRIVNERWSARD
ncbi:dTMP kinase [Bryobacter aggregatus]|uniref:dTMP kinase n=1 Tax=Bryobacter aggregatus TaxID=360054 RepID=UPI0004E1AAEA|nr:dTMP kinase [Bryobacter aggregatus]